MRPSLSPTHRPPGIASPIVRLVTACPRLFVMAPESQDFNHAVFLEYLVYQPMLDVDSPRIGPGKVADELLKRRRPLKWVLSQDGQEFLCLRFQAARSQLFRVLLCLTRKDQTPTHQPGSLAHSSTGVSIPSRIDSRIPGMDSRYSVSWIASQSSSETSTALFLFPVISSG